MSDPGGIGGIGGAEPVSDGERMVPRRAPAAPNGAGSGTDLHEALTVMREQGDMLQQAIVAFNERIAAGEGRTTQLEAQAMRLETTVTQMVSQYNANFQALFARVDMLAQQLARNERLSALENATRSRQPGERADSVVKNAEAYVAFLTPPRPAESPEEPLGPAPVEPPTQH